MSIGQSPSCFKRAVGSFQCRLINDLKILESTVCKFLLNIFCIRFDKYANAGIQGIKGMLCFAIKRSSRVTMVCVVLCSLSCMLTFSFHRPIDAWEQTFPLSRSVHREEVLRRQGDRPILSIYGDHKEHALQPWPIPGVNDRSRPLKSGSLWSLTCFLL